MMEHRYSPLEHHHGRWEADAPPLSHAQVEVLLAMVREVQTALRLRVATQADATEPAAPERDPRLIAALAQVDEVHLLLSVFLPYAQSSAPHHLRARRQISRRMLRLRQVLQEIERPQRHRTALLTLVPQEEREGDLLT